MGRELLLGPKGFTNFAMPKSVFCHLLLSLSGYKCNRTPKNADSSFAGSTRLLGVPLSSTIETQTQTKENYGQHLKIVAQNRRRPYQYVAQNEPKSWAVGFSPIYGYTHFIYINTYTYMYIRVSANSRAYLYVYTHVQMYIYTHMPSYLQVHIHACTHA